MRVQWVWCEGHIAAGGMLFEARFEADFAGRRRSIAGERVGGTDGRLVDHRGLYGSWMSVEGRILDWVVQW